MIRFQRLNLGLLLCVSVSPVAFAYIDTPPNTFGRLCKHSGISVIRIERKDLERSGIVFRKAGDIKGTLPAKQIGLLLPAMDKEASSTLMNKLAIGAEVTVFYLISVDKTKCATYFCFGKSWYFSIVNRTDTDHWIGTAVLSPKMLEVYSGGASELAAKAKEVIEGKEVILPCRIGSREELSSGEGKLIRLRASLKLLTRDVERDRVSEEKR
jgi:hypothetical protein